MSFVIFLLCGFLGGLLGGMGMGGGTALIPLLTLFCGVGQEASQGINLISFLPMAAVALFIHAKNGFLQKKGLGFLIFPALLFSAGGALLAALLPGDVLRKGFGVFLTVLSLFQFRYALGGNKNVKI